ncbi:MAG: AAA family ATPase [Candidatus Woykebacteria bacterium]
MGPAKTFHHKTPSLNHGETGLLSEVETLLKKVEKASLPPDLKLNIEDSLHRLNRSIKAGSYQAEYERAAKYIEWLVALPWFNRSPDKLDLAEAKKILDKSHYGLSQIKDRILEYLAVLKLQKEKASEEVVKLSRSPVICLVGLPGTGKTSFAQSIATTLGRKFARIPMGGMSNPLVLRGQSRTFPEAEPGLIIKNIKKAGTKNPVLLLDEIDSTAEGVESDIMGVLLEILDPEQNFAFADYYIDYPFDLSEVLFICSANQLGKISAAVADRLEVILMPRYTDEDKIHIARDYLFPRELEIVGLGEGIINFDPEVWPFVIKPFGYDVDIRTLQRTVNSILRKIARAYIEGKLKEVVINKTNLRDYLPSW